VYIPLPDQAARRQLSEICLREIKLGPDVDLDDLASKFAGYSGADITNVCRDASFLGMRRRIAGLSAEEIASLNKEEMDCPLVKSDFEETLNRVQPSVGKEEIAKYEQWMKEFGSS